MGRKKLATERFDTNGINKILDFKDIEENATLSTLDESEGPSKSQERLGCEEHLIPASPSQSRGASKDMGTQSNPASNPAMEDQSPEDELEETSLMEPEGWFLKT